MCLYFFKLYFNTFIHATANQSGQSENLAVLEQWKSDAETPSSGVSLYLQYLWLIMNTAGHWSGHNRKWCCSPSRLRTTVILTTARLLQKKRQMLIFKTWCNFPSASAPAKEKTPASLTTDLGGPLVHLLCQIQLTLPNRRPTFGIKLHQPFHRGLGSRARVSVGF